jgi:hypothetical protein
VTEWNYDPNYPAGDTRPTAAFEQQFTQTALQELAKDGVTAAYHFVVTGSSGYQLVDSSPALTAEGQTFGQMYTQLTGGTGQGASTGSSGSSSYVTPSWFCAGSQTGVCVTGTPAPTSATNTTPAPTNVVAPTSMVPSTTISGIVLPSIPQISGAPPTGANRDALHKQIDAIEKQLDALEKKVSNAVHKVIDQIEKQVDAFEKWLLSGGKK